MGFSPKPGIRGPPVVIPAMTTMVTTGDPHFLDTSLKRHAQNRMNNPSLECPRGGPRDPRGPLWYRIAQPSTSRADKSLLNAGDVVAAKTLELESTDVHLPVLNKHVQHTSYPYDFCENEGLLMFLEWNLVFQPKKQGFPPMERRRWEQSATNSVRIHLKQRCCPMTHDIGGFPTALGSLWILGMRFFSNHSLTCHLRSGCNWIVGS